MNIKESDFELFKREYTLSQINFWQISKDVKTYCPNESDVVSIIYFYSDNEHCPTCDDQAAVLDFYKRKLKNNLLIFALDEQFDQEPLITLLKQAYNVEYYPTLIIDGELVYKDVSQEELQEILCSRYRGRETISQIC